jgi:hypothetical protein
VSLDTLAPGEVAAGIVVAPDLRLARQTLRYIAGAAHDTPSIATRIVAETSDTITLQRLDGHTVDLTCLPATRGGSALRGRTLIGAVLDEAAFFRDPETGVVNDAELFKAVAPRVVPDGQVIIASTPWAASGLLFDMFSRNHGHPVDAIAAHAPTLTLRDDAHTRALVERERLRDPDNARNEFDAEFLDSGAAEFFDPAIIAAAIARGDTLAPPHYGDVIVLGLDTAFRRDPCAGVVVRRSSVTELITVLDSIEIRPPPGGALVPSETLRQIVTRAEGFGATEVIADGHYIETLKEHCGSLRVIEAPGGQPGKVETYVKTRSAMKEGKTAIGAQYTRLASQLRQVVGRPQPGGGLSISSPRRAGSHGDLCSAYVLAVHRLATTQPLALKPGTADTAPRRDKTGHLAWTSRTKRSLRTFYG